MTTTQQRGKITWADAERLVHFAEYVIVDDVPSFTEKHWTGDRKPPRDPKIVKAAAQQAKRTRDIEKRGDPCTGSAAGKGLRRRLPICAACNEQCRMRARLAKTGRKFTCWLAEPLAVCPADKWPQPQQPSQGS